jgi:hypothetical protein
MSFLSESTRMRIVFAGLNVETVTSEVAVRVWRERIRRDKSLPWALRAKVIEHIDRMPSDERQRLGKRLAEDRSEAG